MFFNNDIKRIQKSGLFDMQYYLETYQDVKNAGIDPLKHFCEHGWKKGKNPSIKFNTKFYIETYQDVKNANINPLVHYILFGQKEKRKMHIEHDVIIKHKIPKIKKIISIVRYAIHNPYMIKKFFIEIKKQGLKRAIKKVKNKVNISTPIPVMLNSTILDNLLKIEKVENGMLFISHEATLTGAPLVALDLCREYKCHYQKSIVIILMNGGLLQKDFEELGVVINLNIDFLDKNSTSLDAYQMLFEQLVFKGYRECIANTVLSGFLYPCLHHNHIKTVYLIHELPTLINNSGWNQYALNIAESTSSIVFPTQFVAENFSKKYMQNKREYYIIPQGISEEMICPDKKEARVRILNKIGLSNNEDCKLVLGAGFAHHRKGTDLFLSVVEECYKKGCIDNLHFIWLGNRDDYYENWKRRELSELQYKEHIHFIDFETKPAYFFGGADLFLLTSREDPLPGVALVALKNSLPIIMFENTGGVQELINPRNGLLIKQFDTLKMSEGVLNLLNHQKNIMPSTKVNTIPEYFLKVIDLFKNSNNQKISVIIPNYNYERYLEQRLTSIINQSHKPDEIIFLDDCSSDGSVDLATSILKQYDIPFQIIVNDVNQGIYKQWLKGINLAKNDLIWIAEADDYASPDFLCSLCYLLEENENIGLVYAQSKIVDENDKTISENILFHTDAIDRTKWLKSYIAKGYLEMEEALLYRNTIPNVSACIINKKYLKGIEEELLHYRFCGDWFLYSYILKKADIAYCKKSLNSFRKHTSNVTTVNTYKLEYLREVLKIKKYIFSNFKIPQLFYSKMLSLFEKDFLKCNPESEKIREHIKDDLKALEKQLVKHIVFVTFNGEFSGSEVLWYSIAQYLAQNQCKISILCKSNLLNEDKKDGLQKYGVNIVEHDTLQVECLQKLMPDNVLFSIGDHNDGGEFFEYCHKSNIDYVIVNQLVKETMWTTDAHSLKLIFEGYQSAKATFFTCKNNLNIFERKMGSELNNAHIHFNPITIDRNDYVAYPDTNEKYHLAFPARLLTIHKGQDLLIKVLSIPKWQKRNIQVNFYGEGPDYDELLRLANDLHVMNIKFHGYVNNIRSIWENNHAFILTSHMEGVPVVLMGAMFAGRVAIVTDVGGNKEVLKDNLTGFIAHLPSEESIDEVLEQAWAVKDRWEAMGKAARISILQYYPEDPLKHFEEELKKVFQW